jgi:PleD family two-component response regulator
MDYSRTCMQQVLPRRSNLCTKQHVVTSYGAENFAVVRDAQKFPKSTIILKLIGQKGDIKQFPYCGLTNIWRHRKK